jgi:putative oxidoreductase
MKKLMSTKYSAGAFNFAMLLLRAGLGGLMITHGYDKLVNYGKYRGDFMNFLGIGSSMSLALLIFAEFFCSLFLIFGLFSRLVTIPLIIGMSVAVAKAHNLEIFGEGEHATLFIVGFLTILIVGPGKLSVDGMIGK